MSEVRTPEELRALPEGTVLVTADNSVGVIKDLSRLDDDGNIEVALAIFWAGSDIWDYLDGFTLSDYKNLLPATVIYNLNGAVK